ncbi:MAG TPA: OmpA family protein [Blastocatellia bacterium]|nr:OmpA family protein [Blastocatellia bacterium]
MKRFVFSLLMTAMFAVGALAQTAQDTFAKRTTLAVRYVENKKTTVNLNGTSLAPRVLGKADVEYKKNEARIRIKVENLDNPQTYGVFYTTYVVWAVTPEGQADNLTEMPSGYAAELQAMSTAQTFGLIVTAEPHNAVKFPSPKVVAETSLPKNATAGVQTVQAEYKADKGNLYETNDNDSLKADYTTPRLILGARRSMDIARKAGAKEFAAAEWKQAEGKLNTLEQVWPRNLKDETKFSGMARDVMRLAQVARDLSAEREEQARIENERQERLRRLAEAQASAERAQAEANRIRLEADKARAEAERAKAQAENAKMEAEKAERAASEERARREAASRESEAVRLRAENERRAAEESVRRASAEKAAAEEATRRAEAEKAAARAEAEKANKAAEEAKRERDAAYQKLYVSLSEILDTKRETRGYIVNLGDVLFDTGKATLKPAAREKLSKLAGILLAYPGNLMLEIEGHTDSVGSDELNNKLSQNRAEAVSSYLTESGVKPEKIKAARGFGKTKPIATNDTAAGRQQNRRVEVVIEDADAKKPN